MAILLKILSVIGVILLVVVCLVLALVLLVLLVPVRYRTAAVKHGDTLLVSGNGSWLLHLIQVPFTYRAEWLRKNAAGDPKEKADGAQQEDSDGDSEENAAGAQQENAAGNQQKNPEGDRQQASGDDGPEKITIKKELTWDLKLLGFSVKKYLFKSDTDSEDSGPAQETEKTGEEKSRADDEGLNESAKDAGTSAEKRTETKESQIKTDSSDDQTAIKSGTGGTGDKPGASEETGDKPEASEGTGDKPGASEGTGDKSGASEGTGDKPGTSEGSGDKPGTSERKSAEHKAADAYTREEAARRMREGAKRKPAVQPGEKKKESEIPIEIVPANRPNRFEMLLARYGELIGKLRKKMEKGKSAAEVIMAWLDYVDSASFEHAVSCLKREITAMLRHIMPRKISGTIEYGLGDPAYTGEILAGIASFYPVLPKDLTIIPDFEEQRLEADTEIKGQIVIGVLVYRVLKLLLTRDVRDLIARIRAKNPEDPMIRRRVEKERKRARKAAAKAKARRRRKRKKAMKQSAGNGNGNHKGGNGNYRNGNGNHKNGNGNYKNGNGNHKNGNSNLKTGNGKTGSNTNCNKEMNINNRQKEADKDGR